MYTTIMDEKKKKPVSKEKSKTCKKTAKKIGGKLSKEREYQRKLMRTRRAASRDIGDRVKAGLKKIDWQRRNACEHDRELFCTIYFSDIFYTEFTEDQREIIKGIEERIVYGGYQAIAAERGGGKSTITKIVAGIHDMAYGWIKYLVIIGASAEFAKGILSDIKDLYIHSEKFIQDFPEVCIPILALEGISQRAASQLCNDKATRMIWKDNEVMFPRVEISKGKLSPISGSIIKVRGIDGSIRGLVKGALRPDLVICDDLETTESANSQGQTEKRITILQTDVLGLASMAKRMSIIMLGTVICSDCLIDQFTNQELHPEWNGIRHKRLKRLPDRMDLWQKYMEMRKRNQREGDDTGRAANQFYLDNRTLMDLGAIVSNQNRYDKRTCRDKSQYESSALQASFNAIADMGWDNFNVEYNNDPPRDLTKQNHLEYYDVMDKVSYYERYEIPTGCVHKTGFIDVHLDRLYWSVVAWQDRLTGFVCDYGAIKFDVPIKGTVEEEVRKRQILIAIEESLNGLTQHIYDTFGALDIGHVDAGYMPDAVYEFIRKQIRPIWRPSIGGSNSSGSYRSPQRSRTVRYVGEGYHESYQAGPRCWLTIFDPNKFKMLAQEGFRVKDGPGKITLWGSEPSIHKVFSEHICAEHYDVEKKKFVRDSSNNHWFDCLTGCIMGEVRLGSTISENNLIKPIKKQQKTQIPTTIRTKY